MSFHGSGCGAFHRRPPTSRRRVGRLVRLRRGHAAAWCVGLCVAGGAGVEEPLASGGQRAPAGVLGCGEGGPALAAELGYPMGVTATRDGGLLIADASYHIVCRVSPGGVITRIAGIGLPGNSGDRGPATAARLEYPACAREEASGAVLITTGGRGERVRRVSPAGTITTVRTGAPRCDTATLANGDRLVADPGRFIVRRVGRDGGGSVVVAGTGRCGVSAGDGGKATKAVLAWPAGVAALPDGGFLIVDSRNETVRRVSRSGIITTVAGRGRPPGTPNGKVCIQAEGNYLVPNYVVIRGPVRARAHRPVVVRYETTFDVSARITIKQGNRTLGQFRERGKSGYSQARLVVSLAPGMYSLLLRATGLAPESNDEPPTVPFTKTAVAQLVITP